MKKDGQLQFSILVEEDPHQTEEYPHTSFRHSQVLDKKPHHFDKKTKIWHCIPEASCHTAGHSWHSFRFIFHKVAALEWWC
jgi:hypothetical protein